MWVDAREDIPFSDGWYLIQTVTGNVVPMSYTFKGGWNTYYSHDGKLHGDKTEINYLYVVRWFMPETPPEVKDEWYKEWFDHCIEKHRKEK